MDSNTLRLIREAELSLKSVYKKIDETALYNFNKVLEAFQKNKISQRHFSGTTGYGYGDVGRDTLNALFADITSSQAAIFSPYLASGTHALTVALFGLLRPSGLLLSISGKPYDTLNDVISKENAGSLKDFGINYEFVEFKNDKFDTLSIKNILLNNMDVPKVVFLQRSKGYNWRDALSLTDIKKICGFVKAIDEDIVILTDNCYGEFTDKLEPTQVGADLIAGSLIKNPGGGLAPTGGYIAGKKHLIERISNRFTAPSIGTEITSFVSGYLSFYQGLFFAPNVVAAALKGCALMTALFDKLGYKTMPKPGKVPLDIITSIEFHDKKQLIDFMRIIQKTSPVDSFVTPEPWAMPGYEHEVIMAAGGFIGGSSIELSADAPIKSPYIGYLQGGLTYEHVKIAAINCADYFLHNVKESI
ncbi:MAG: methionine gamma-lyase family protein [Clostridiales bacterium]|jgi:cystathionine beta-lyase family protein involved in aluminum resistance|nr:methionine gamma-lyase family protein [Clostridiales bacterium]